MTTYIKLSTLEYPLYEGDIRLVHTEIPEHLTYPNFPCPEDYAEVVVVVPEYNVETHFIKEIAPKQINGVWYAQFTPPIEIPLWQLNQNKEQNYMGSGPPPPPITSSGRIHNVIA
jgi:hypothetical protein